MSNHEHQHPRDRLHSLLKDMGVPERDAHYEAFGADPVEAS